MPSSWGGSTIGSYRWSDDGRCVDSGSDPATCGASRLRAGRGIEGGGVVWWGGGVGVWRAADRRGGVRAGVESAPARPLPIAPGEQGGSSFDGALAPDGGGAKGTRHFWLRDWSG